MDVREFPLLSVHNLNDDDTIKTRTPSIKCNLRSEPVELHKVRTPSTRSSSRSSPMASGCPCPKNQRCLLTPLAQLQLSPPLAQRLLTLPLALLLPCQTQDLLLGHQLWLIPPVQMILVQIAPSLNLASRRKE